MANKIQIEGKEGLQLKAGSQIRRDTPLLCLKGPQWVSRSGEKLAGALIDLSLTKIISGVWLDSGASTGGFCQVLLENGADRIYGVDVGYGQLDQKIAENEKVIVRDKCNLRKITSTEIPEPLDGITLDLSFISLRLVLPVLSSFLKPSASIIAMVKPQFEGNREDIGKGGIVKTEEIRTRILEDFEEWCLNHSWSIEASTPARIKGKQGNQEHFYLLQRSISE